MMMMMIMMMMLSIETYSDISLIMYNWSRASARAPIVVLPSRGVVSVAFLFQNSRLQDQIPLDEGAILVVGLFEAFGGSIFLGQVEEVVDHRFLI